jgi:signal transduction histidine kinase
MNVLNRLVLHAELGAERTALPTVAAHFERIHAGSVRAAELVSLMRRYLRGERAAAPEPVSPAAIVEEVVELLRPSMPRDLALTLALDPACVVLAEPVHVHQVVLNLVTNALQALDGRSAPRLAITVAPVDGDRVELVVCDDGPGLPAAVRARLFEPYVTSRAARGGTGLGLAVVRAIVADMLGGEVRADDAPGGGARFVVRLPAAAPARAPRAALVTAATGS